MSAVLLRSPESVVQAQLDAYNAHDVDALVAIYAADVQQFEHPSTLLATGSAQLRERFTARFASAQPQATLLQRIVCGNMVIDHEAILSQTADGAQRTELVAMYEVDGEHISKAWFKFGATTTA